MDRGGTETWLMHILRRIDRKVFAMDFLTQTSEPGQFDEEIRDLGSRIIPCLYPSSRPWTYASQMRRVLKRNGPYQIVHSHVHHYNGFVLRLANSSGVPVRIAHSHNDTSPVDAAANFGRRRYLALSRHWISKFASCKIAASRQAALSLFGSPGLHNQWRILPYGVDFEPFRSKVDTASVRAELGIPHGHFVIGHVGRFVEQKNHSFFVRVAEEVVRRDARIHFLLAGDGPLRRSIEQQVTGLNLSGHFSFLGVRSDVPRLMLGGMDAFLFPSLHEGLGLVLVEAQAAGIPCIYSDRIPEEADIVGPLVHRLPLEHSPSDWADAVLALRSHEKPLNHATAYEAVKNSNFNIETSLCGLEEVYRTSAYVNQAA